MSNIEELFLHKGSGSLRSMPCHSFLFYLGSHTLGFHCLHWNCSNGSQVTTMLCLKHFCAICITAYSETSEFLFSNNYSIVRKNSINYFCEGDIEKHVRWNAI